MQFTPCPNCGSVLVDEPEQLISVPDQPKDSEEVIAYVRARPKCPNVEYGYVGEPFTSGTWKGKRSDLK
jgi:hypothetical protein